MTKTTIKTMIDWTWNIALKLKRAAWLCVHVCSMGSQGVCAEKCGEQEAEWAIWHHRKCPATSIKQLFPMWWHHRVYFLHILIVSCIKWTSGEERSSCTAQAESWAVATGAVWLLRGVSMEPDSEPTFRAYLLCGNKQTHSGGLCVAKLC